MYRPPASGLDFRPLPASNQPCRGRRPRRHAPTLSQYLLNPRKSHRMLGPEVLDNLLCSEFGVALPNRTDTDSCGRAPIQPPAHLSLGGAPSSGGLPTGSQVGLGPDDANRVLGFEHLDNLASCAVRKRLPNG